MALQNYSILPISQYLASSYKIPNYQREYSWEEYELNDFWNDLVNLCESEDKNSTHFFGQIVIHNDSNKHEKYIIDGQQRTITSVIFLKVLHNHFGRLYASLIGAGQASSSLTANIQRSQITIENLLWQQDENEKRKYQLLLGEADNGYFQKSIMEDFPSDKKKRNAKKSQERLRYSYYYLDSKINEKLKVDTGSLSVEEQNKILRNINNVLLTRFKVLYMEATDLSEAFTIFETLNARGKDLETADLLKNFLFSKSGDTDEAQKQWDEMIDNLSNYDVTKYIRYYWNSSHKLARDKILYREISNSISTRREVLEMMSDMNAMSICFHDLAFPEDCTFFSNKEIKKVLKNLSLLKATTFFPVILAMEQARNSDFQNEDNILSVLETIENFIFRNFTISKYAYNSAEVFMASLAKQIFDGDCSTIEEITNKIKAETIPDSIFEENFRNWTGGPTAKEAIRYIFRKIHNHHSLSLEINIDNSDVQIEHIMPQDKTLWPEIDEQSHAEYLWKLGNLCLLDGSFNKSNSNKPFADKKETYKTSLIKPNSEIADYSSWGVNEIKERQKKLAQDALKIWKL